jgi:hypothetical protein
MTPENTNAQEKALEALIAASLRAPDKETEVTEAEISRYVDQRVTLSSEDEAALEKAKPRVMQSIGIILQGNLQEDDDCTIRPSKAEHAEQFCAMNRKNTTNEFSQITESELDRKRREMIERVKKKQGRVSS